MESGAEPAGLLVRTELGRDVPALHAVLSRQSDGERPHRDQELAAEAVASRYEIQQVTAKSAKHAEIFFLCGLCDLRGCFSSGCLCQTKISKRSSNASRRRTSVSRASAGAASA